MRWLKRVLGIEKPEPEKPVKVLPMRLDAERCPYCGLKAGSFGCGMCERKAKQGA